MISKIEFKNNHCYVNDQHFFELTKGNIFEIDFLIKRLVDIGINTVEERTEIIEFCHNRLESTGFEFKQAKDELSEKKLRFISSKELMNTPKEKGFIIQGMMQKNTVNGLISPAGSFKSTLALLAAVCVSNGKDFLGFKTKKCPVAYLDKENNRQFLRDKLHKVFNGLKLHRKAFPLFFLLKEGMLTNEEFVLKLSDYLKENKVGLLVFDTLVRFNAGEENSAHDMNLIYQAFVELQRNTGTAILFLHHTNRKGEFRGSSDILGQVDAMYQIERKKDTGQFVLKNEKNRCGEINDVSGEIVFSDEQIVVQIKEETIDSEEEVAEHEKFVLARAFILDFAKSECLTENHCFERSELITALEAWNSEHDKEKWLSKRLVDSTLRHLTKIHFLRKGDKRGQYYLNNAKSEVISKWIAPIGLGSALNPDLLQEEKKEDGL